jgi:hypothetical protein
MTECISAHLFESITPLMIVTSVIGCRFRGYGSGHGGFVSG